ncbi:5-oxoprolinase subunit PxpA [Alkalibacterium sp. m-11]
MKIVDLNCDLGESFGAYTLGLDKDILPYISSANIACGFHASDPMVMAQTVEEAEKNNVAIGAHPGFYDLMGFGRRKMSVSMDEARNYIKYQIGALSAFSKTGKRHHVKPHGALYNMASTDYNLARAICEGIREVDDELILYGLANSQLIRAAQDTGLSYAQEVFADRNYNNDGTLVHRQHEDALITDEDVAVERVVQMVEEGNVKSVTGEWIDLQPDTICMHGDNPKAVQFATRIHKALTEKRVTIVPVTGRHG